MGILLDTNVLIRAERGVQAVDFSRWQDRGSAFISAITASELLIGVHRADSEARRVRRSAFVEGLLAAIPVLEFGLEAARIHARVTAHLARQGRLIGPHDLIIAATALSYGYAVLTANLDEFQRVPGLEVLSVD
jgi:tRNA(fMet)-specific endonuclease VapC